MLGKKLFTSRQVNPDVLVVDFTGRVSTPAILVADVERFIKKQIEGGSRKLVLDFSKVEFLDSSGVGVLVVCSSVMEKAGGRMVIAGATGYVKEALQMVHLDRVIPLHADLAAACESLGASSAPPASA
ncbi:MAG TPA: STAS domain-containing protein [Terriglobia bacterium]|nr:STAS domain-containing protein [Terriglobia bacterium]